MAKSPSEKQNPDETAPTGSGPLEDIDGPTLFSIASEEDAPIIIKPGSNEFPVEGPRQDPTED